MSNFMNFDQISMKKYKYLQYKTIALESPQSIFSYYVYLALWILILFPQFLVKVYKIWLRLNPEHELNKNEGSTLKAKYIQVQLL
jgi:hypothetical protein